MKLAGKKASEGASAGEQVSVSESAGGTRVVVVSYSGHRAPPIWTGGEKIVLY